MFVKPQGETNLKMTTEDYRIHLTTSVNSYGKGKIKKEDFTFVYSECFCKKWLWLCKKELRLL